MSFLDRLLGREKKEDMPAEPEPRREDAEPAGMGEPPPMAPEPGSEGSQTEHQP